MHAYIHTCIQKIFFERHCVAKATLNPPCPATCLLSLSPEPKSAVPEADLHPEVHFHLAVGDEASLSVVRV